MTVVWEKLICALLTIDLFDAEVLNFSSCSNVVLDFGDLVTCFFELCLHKGSLFDSGWLCFALRYHGTDWFTLVVEEILLIEVIIGIHSNDDLQLRVVSLDLVEDRKHLIGLDYIDFFFSFKMDC